MVFGFCEPYSAEIFRQSGLVEEGVERPENQVSLSRSNLRCSEEAGTKATYGPTWEYPDLDRNASDNSVTCQVTAIADARQ